MYVGKCIVGQDMKPASQPASKPVTFFLSFFLSFIHSFIHSFFFLGEEKKIIILRNTVRSGKKVPMRIKFLFFGFCVINAIYCLATLASFL